MNRHHRDLRLPSFPRPYPEKQPSRPFETECLRPLLILLLLQGLTLLLLVTDQFPLRLQLRGIPSRPQTSLARLLDSQAIAAPVLRCLKP